MDVSRRMHSLPWAILGVCAILLGIGGSLVWAQDDSNARPTVIMREGLAPTRTSPDNTQQVTLFAEGDNAWMGKLRLKPGASLDPQQDAGEKLLFVLRGSGRVTIDGTPRELQPATGVRIPAGSTSSLENGDRLMVALQIFAGPEPANKYSSWRVGELALTEGGKKRPSKARNARRSGQSRVLHRKGQIRRSPDDNVEVAEVVDGSNAWMGLLRVGAGGSIGEHRDPTEKYLYVLQGEGTLTIDGVDYRLAPHTGIYIPSKQTASFQNGDGLFTAVQVFAGPESADKYDDWSIGSSELQPAPPPSKKDQKKSSGDMPSLKLNGN